MNIEKICEALSATDKLGDSIRSGCAIGQLFYFAGKTENDIVNGISPFGGPYIDMFNGLLVKEYGMTEDDELSMFRLNDHFMAVDRHARVLAHYEGLLIECLISQSSSQVEGESSHCEGVLIAQ